MNKKGVLLTDQTVELLISAAVVAALLMMMWVIIAPDYDEVDRIAEGYLDSFSRAVEVASEGGIGEFTMLPREGDVHFYLAYFGDKMEFDYGNFHFSAKDSNKNNVCVCALRDDETLVCRHCLGLDFPISGVRDNIVFHEDKRFLISQKGDFYEFIEG